MPVWMSFRSVPQTPQARTWTRTSSSPGTGTGRSNSSNRCGATRTVAVMVAGIAMVAPFKVEIGRQVVYMSPCLHFESYGTLDWQYTVLGGTECPDGPR